MSYTYLDEVSQPARPSRIASRHYRVWVKRVFDVVVVLLATPIVLPIVFLAWALTMLNGGSGIFSQPRIGKNGREFKCWKIRTMVLDADDRLQQMIKADPKIAAEWGCRQKLENDPRITRLGLLLRRTSLDELPQFWNVLIGDMSLIGPRPFTPCQKKLYDSAGSDPAYYRLRPGISGLWQVDCRNEGAFQDRVTFDETYAQKMSLWFDLKIVLRTLSVVAHGTGK